MCSATHVGFRRRRSKEDTREARVARSATGPGNPYWKRPAGSTGATANEVAGLDAGTGRFELVVDVVEIVVLEATAWTLFSLRVEYIAAVAAAPAPALSAAMIAIVDLDIVREKRLKIGGGLVYTKY